MDMDDSPKQNLTQARATLAPLASISRLFSVREAAMRARMNEFTVFGRSHPPLAQVPAYRDPRMKRSAHVAIVGRDIDAIGKRGAAAGLDPAQIRTHRAQRQVNLISRA